MEKENTTDKLNNILKDANIDDFSSYVEKNEEHLFPGKKEFYHFMVKTIKMHHLNQTKVSIQAEMDYGLLNQYITMEKHTPERDNILRICIGGKFTLSETNTALKLYGVSELYSKVPRDALIIICINKEIYDLDEVNDVLAKNKFERLN